MKTFAYVGKWELHRTDKPVGFDIFAYDEESGALRYQGSQIPELVVGSTCLDAGRGILYAAHENDVFPATGEVGCGAVYAIKLDGRTGGMEELNYQPSYGYKCSYCALDPERKYLVATNVTGKNVVTKVVLDETGAYRACRVYDDAPTVLFTLEEDGSISGLSDVYIHSGRGGSPSQTNAQGQSVVASPNGKQFMVCDKGSDKITVFQIDRDANKLVVAQQFATYPGSAPRYSVFHPTKPLWFLNNELMPVVCSYSFNEDGVFTLVSSEVAAQEGQSSSILLSPDGKYLYNIVREVNGIAVMSVSDKGGLKRIQYVTVPVPEGTHPMERVRGGAISPDGRFLLVTVMATGQVLRYAIGKDGKLAEEPAVAAENIYHAANITFYQA